jgi:hypothetical protein
MTRSRRHMPIIGNAASKSEKDDKQRAAMRERKHVNDKIKSHVVVDGEFEVASHITHPRSGQWSFAKDGKHFMRNPSPKDLRK